MHYLNMKFKDLFRFKYPKTLVLILAISFAYVIFSNKSTGDFILALNSFSYLGAFIADLIIFSLVKLSFKDEFEILRKTKLIRNAGILIEKSVGKKIKTYLMYVFAGILISSPLPDEIGITVFAGL